MFFDRTIYGPGRTPRSRVVLARPGVDYTPAEVEKIQDLAECSAEPTEKPTESIFGGELPPPETPLPVVGPTAGEPDPGESESDPGESGGVGEVTHVGGGWFELPNGDRIRGREEAEAALAGLTEG